MLVNWSNTGAKVTGVIEFNGGIYNKGGLDISALLEHRKLHKTFEGFPGATFVADGKSMLEYECDLLIPAALEQQVNAKNAGNIKAKLVAEAANGPLTPAAHDLLVKKGVVIIPDLLCNAGGVTVSYFEWLKNLSHVRFGRIQKRWDQKGKSDLVALIEKISPEPLSKEERENITRGAEEHELVYSGLEDTMITACKETHTAATEKGIDHRTAAFSNAITKIASKYEGSGMLFMR
jgi:glutamate dehydrogenase (NAD(P)+)